jgi:uncharacterized tellurite resistance protein B-like protein
MAKNPLAMALAKVMIAAAWADDHLASDEVNSLKNLLAELDPGGGHGELALTMQDWAELDIYLYSPVDATERRRLVEELAASMRGPKDRAIAFEAIDRLVGADRVTTDEERRVAEEIRAALARADVGPLGALGGLLRRGLGVRAGGPNREQFIDEFSENRVYYALRVRLGKAPEEALGIPAAEARKLALGAGILATVARSDREVDAAERERIVAALEQGWGLAHAHAALVAEAAIAESDGSLDLYRLTYSFALSATVEERVRLLDGLFAVAGAHGGISGEESAEISRIASAIRLEQRHFVEAKRRALGG